MSVIRLLGARTFLSVARIFSSSSSKDVPPAHNKEQRKAWIKQQWMLRESRATTVDKLDKLDIKLYPGGKTREKYGRSKLNMGALGDKMENLLKKYICEASERFGRKDIVETLEKFPNLQELRLLADTEEEYLTDEEFERWNAFLEAQEDKGFLFLREILQMIYMDLCNSEKDGKVYEEGKNQQTKARYMDSPRLKNIVSINPENLKKATLREKKKFLKDSVETLRELYPTAGKSFQFDDMHLIIQGAEQVLGVLDIILSTVFNDREHDFVSFIQIDELAKHEDESMSAEEIRRWNLVKEAFGKDSGIDEYHNMLINSVLYLHSIMSGVLKPE